MPDRKTREACLLNSASSAAKTILLRSSIVDRSETGRPHFHVSAWEVKLPTTALALILMPGTPVVPPNRDGTIPAIPTTPPRSCWRAKNREYVASATPDLPRHCGRSCRIQQRFGFGQINCVANPDPVAYARYLAKRVTNGVRRFDHPDDRGLRRIRFWGNYPRKVSQPFHLITKDRPAGAASWHFVPMCWVSPDLATFRSASAGFGSST